MQFYSCSVLEEDYPPPLQHFKDSEEDIVLLEGYSSINIDGKNVNNMQTLR